MYQAVIDNQIVDNLSLAALQAEESILHTRNFTVSEFNLVYSTSLALVNQIVSTRTVINNLQMLEPTGYVSPAELRRREREEAVRREREALEAERRLLEEEAALALEKEVEAMFRQMLDEPDGPFAAQILEKVPAVLRSRGGLENPLVQKACRMQISYMLQDAVGAGQ